MIPLPDKKYSIIYADPPWSYQNRGTRAAASKHYDTMTIEDIKRMGVGAAGRSAWRLPLWCRGSDSSTEDRRR